MRIVIDMQGAQTESRFRGIGRFAMAFAQALVRNRGRHEIVLALNGLFPETIEPIRAAFPQLAREHIRVWYAVGPVREGDEGNEWRRRVAEQIREAMLASLEPDVVVVASLFEGYVDDAVTAVAPAARAPTAVVFHDLIPLLNREMYLDPHPRYERFYRGRVAHLKRADLLLAISQWAAQEAQVALGSCADKVVVISAAYDPVFRCREVSAQEKQVLHEKFGIVRPFVLYSGAADPRKNLPRLIHAYAALPPHVRAAHQLVLAGKMHHEEVLAPKQAVKAAGLRSGEVVFTGYVSEAELIALYNTCSVFVLPSLHEGFGLPALEAMACGAPVIGSNTSSIPEVIGNPAALFDPRDEASITRKLLEALSNASFQEALRKSAREQIGRFSWDATAERALEALGRLQGRARGGARGAADRLVRQAVDAVAARVPASASASELRAVAHALAWSVTEDRGPRQLLVDVSELVQRDARTGVQRVTRNILRELLASPPNGYVVKPVWADAVRSGYRYANEFAARAFSTVGDTRDEAIDCAPGDVFLGLDFQPQVVPAQSAYFARLRRHGVAVWFVLHDLLPVLLPHTFPPGNAEAHARWLAAIAQADGVVCVSRAVREEFLGWLERHHPERRDAVKLEWFHPGADIEGEVPMRGMPGDAEEVLRAVRARPTFLMVGTLEPRKRHAQALSAFERLWEEGRDIGLAIVGKQGWMVEELTAQLRAHPERGRRLFWLESISDEYLEALYRAARCLVAASEGEGFGLPLVEAARHGLPMLVRDIPVFREVAGSHAAYFRGLDPSELATAVAEWLALHAAGAHPRSERLPWHPWRESARMLLERVLGPESTAPSRPAAAQSEGAYARRGTAVQGAFGSAT
ncbi:MAG TPA: glycosyltransferase family 1 protein [Burkholderiales bacterium]